ncbi:MAG: hypothetical protein HQK51_13755 [Oligoflexia bacterium]|nr:hypothetical protein [Oligoflexia bacterium]
MSKSNKTYKNSLNKNKEYNNSNINNAKILHHNFKIKAENITVKKRSKYFLNDNSPVYFLVIMAFLSFLLFLSACSNNKEVVGVTQNQSSETKNTEHFVENACSERTIIKPKVDFLFLWDNSSSFNFINSDTKNSLRNTINQFSSRFDYHVVLAPLLINESTNTQNNPPLYLMLDNTNGVSPSIIQNNNSNVKIIPNDNTSKINSFNNITGVASNEHGLKRITNIITDTNVDNGLFRKNAYTIVVLISGGNVNDYPNLNGSDATKAIREAEEQKYYQLLTNLKLKLSSEQFRLISIVPHTDSLDYATSCPKAGIKKGSSYINVSELLYADLTSSAKDAQSDQNKDHYDLCKNDYSHIFDGLNQTIQDILIKHVYNFWRIATTTNKSFDPKKITVVKNTGVALVQDDANGFRYIGYRENQPTRKLPSIGEVQTGHFIELLGTAVVTYPECLNIETQEPADYYNYVVLNEKPNVDSIVIEINGKSISKSQSNGWWYEDYYTSKNIKVVSPTDSTPVEPGEYKSGYMIRLYGSAVYTNSSKLKYSYNRAPID